MLISLIIIIFGLVLASAIYVKTDRLGEARIDAVVILSGNYNWDTRLRVKAGLKRALQLGHPTIVLCGQQKAALMANLAKQSGYAGRWIIQANSSNTYEDALFTAKLFEAEPQTILLVTSGTHQRRSYHTFARVFNQSRIVNAPVNDWLTWYSPLLPLAWLGMVMNIYKDCIYNRKFW